jgi:hypothetical protein
MQCIKDLRASAYLLLSCHYRSAIQLLRPVVENCITGLYWDAKFSLARQNEIEVVNQQFSDFGEDKFKIPILEWRHVFPNDHKTKPKKRLDFHYCFSWLKNEKDTAIDDEAGNEASKLVDELNKYLHPSPTHMEIGKKGSPACLSSVSYQAKEYEHCVELFQDVGALLMQVFYKYMEASDPDKAHSEEVFTAIGYVKTLESLEKLGRRFIFSNQLKAFLLKMEFLGEHKPSG